MRNIAYNPQSFACQRASYGRSSNVPAALRILPVALLALGMGAISRGLPAQQPPDRSEQSRPKETSPTPANGWPLESITLETQQVLRGVVVASDEEGVDFAEVVRPPGRPMFVVIRRIARDEIAEYSPLPEAERETSLKLLAKFRRRVLIDQARMETILLEEGTFEGFACRRYSNPWFTLWSQADDETTRRCALRIEQMVRAYRQLFPPQDAQRPLRILLLASLEDYGDYLRQHGLDVQNPAFYSRKQNLIVAASDVGDVGRRLAEVRREHQQLLKQLEDKDREFQQRLAALRVELLKAGFSLSDITREKTARLRSWNAERESQIRSILAANRRNEASFHKLTIRMVRRLYHESFHAYLDNYVFTSPGKSLPRWLNEGLAQIFEGGQLDAGRLRIDAPDAALLRRLQEDFAQRPRLSIAALVSARPESFVNAHDNPHADRFYLHAWGLAYYLTFLAPTAGDPLESFASTSETPLEQVLQYVEQNEATLERDWRAAIQDLSVGG